VTTLWGILLVALAASCYLPGNNWVAPAAGYAPLHWLVLGTFSDDARGFFLLQGLFGMLAGSGILLHIPWGRILTSVLGVVAILWCLACVDAYIQQDETYAFKRVLLPFAAVQAGYGILTAVILIKYRAAFARLERSAQSQEGRHIYVLAAWASPAVAAISCFVLWSQKLFEAVQLARGVLPTQAAHWSHGAQLFNLCLLCASILAGLAAVISVFGIRSWRNAASIIPAALLGVCMNGTILFLTAYGLALDGRHF